jgi:hypothetical protein
VGQPFTYTYDLSGYKEACDQLCELSLSVRQR